MRLDSGIWESRVLLICGTRIVLGKGHGRRGSSIVGGAAVKLFRKYVGFDWLYSFGAVLVHGLDNTWERNCSRVGVCGNCRVDIIDHGYRQIIFAMLKTSPSVQVFLMSSSPLRPHSADMHPAASSPQCNSSCPVFH